MDRESDLTFLNQQRNNSDLPLEIRRRAHRAYETIREQLKNKPLMEARARLLRAEQAGDGLAAEKIEAEIHYRFGH